MDTLKTLHIIGYKNSGKTTLISNWIQTVKELGLKVAVIKHHGHGAKLAMPDERKDSMQYLIHGADQSVVSGGGYTQHMTAEEMNMEGMLASVKQKNPDVIFVEGYKDAPGEKVVLLRDQDDWGTLKQIENIQLVIGHHEVIDYPQIENREQKQLLNDWLKKWLSS